MSELPQSVTTSGLWKRLEARSDLISPLKYLRGVAEALGSKIAHLIPAFTDHSVTHMDSLWALTDVIMTEAEINRLSFGEAFILASAFYVHDLGMAMAATEEGRLRLEQSPEFIAEYQRSRRLLGYDNDLARQVSLRMAARALHASLALELVDEKLPGLDRFLIEPTEIREAWGDYIGKVAASHHWSINEVEAQLGRRGRIPDTFGGKIDLAYLACLIRLIDYAHINATRASGLERALRSDLNEESIVHWLAQERVSGPEREGNLLVYASQRSIQDVDAWWLFFEMASGLDNEIAAVVDYLRSRTISSGRLTLEGVRGVRSPQAFAALVSPDDFDPLDVRIRMDSTNRLVQILGGRSLYGSNRFAAVRELLQNSRDAIKLRQVVDAEAGRPSRESGSITICWHADDTKAYLEVSDDGVGMSETIVSRYLLGIASEYWESADFFAEFPTAVESGFKPAGRFGIGFLSVFTLGENVYVRTQRGTAPTLSLQLRGIGRRGALRKTPSSLETGTTVRVLLTDETRSIFRGLARIVQAIAPLLEIEIKVRDASDSVTIRPGWWKTIKQRDLVRFIAERAAIASTPAFELEQRKQSNQVSRRHWRQPAWEHGWVGNSPEVVTDNLRVIATPRAGKLVLCSRGIAVMDAPVRGLTGMVEVGDVELNAARSSVLLWDPELFKLEVMPLLKPQILSAVARLADEGRVPHRFEFLRQLATTYGTWVLTESTLPWITVLEAPGNAILLTAEQFRLKVRNKKVGIAYGEEVNPWSVGMAIRHAIPSIDDQAVLVPVSNAGAAPIGSFREEDQPFQGSLSDVFRTETSFDASFEDATLLQGVLQVLADAWATDVDRLTSQTWIRRQQTLFILLNGSAPETSSRTS
jgi:hypothetical protein